MLIAGIASENRLITVPEPRPATTMLLEDQRRLLYYLADEPDGPGLIVDAGCFPGGSGTALALNVIATGRTHDPGAGGATLHSANTMSPSRMPF